MITTSATPTATPTTAATKALTGVLLPGPGAGEPVAGVPLIVRAAILLRRIGCQRVVVPLHPDDPRARSIAKLERVEGMAFDSQVPADAPCVVIAGDVAFHSGALRELAGEATGRGRVARTPGAWIGAGPSSLFASAAESWRAAGSAAAPEADAASVALLPAGTPGERRAASTALLRATSKPEDGLLARLFERRVSQAISGALVPFRISPNVLTSASLLIGLAGASLLATTVYELRALGAATFVFAAILDGCDGEVARVKLLESEFGRLYDTAVDVTVSLAVFAAIGIGTWRELGDVPEVRVATTLLVAGGFFAMLVVESVRRIAPLEGPASGRAPAGVIARANAWLERFATFEWSYLVLALALAGQLPFFFFGAAIGANVFALVYLALGVVAWRRG